VEKLRVAWRELLAELEQSAPGTRRAIRPPGQSASGAETRLPVPLNEELRSWFHLHGGCDPWADGQIFPFNTAIDLPTAVEDTLRIRDIWQATSGGEEELRQLARRQAGTTARTWLDSYVAISSDLMGDCLFVDLRPGVLHGCVRWWDKVGADDDFNVVATSITALLIGVTSSLRTNRPIGGWTPRLDHGVIQWEP
jgi:cell wall assembly regulator SMI1